MNTRAAWCVRGCLTTRGHARGDHVSAPRAVHRHSTESPCLARPELAVSVSTRRRGTPRRAGLGRGGATLPRAEIPRLAASRMDRLGTPTLSTGRSAGNRQRNPNTRQPAVAGRALRLRLVVAESGRDDGARTRQQHLRMARDLGPRDREAQPSEEAPKPKEDVAVFFDFVF